MKNVAALVAIGVRADGHHEILGVAEGGREEEASWLPFFRSLPERGLTVVQLMVGDKCRGLVEALGKRFPQAAWQRGMVHCLRNVATLAPKGKAQDVVALLKALHGQEDRAADDRKTTEVVAKL